MAIDRHSGGDPLTHRQRRARRPQGASTPLRRSREQRVVAGVCGGIAEFIGVAPGLVRATWLLSLIPSLGLTALAYPAMWILLPRTPAPGPGESIR